MTCSLIVKTCWFRVVNAAPRLLSTCGRPWHASRASLSVLSKLMLLAKPLKVGAAAPPRKPCKPVGAQQANAARKTFKGRGRSAPSAVKASCGFVRAVPSRAALKSMSLQTATVVSTRPPVFVLGQLTGSMSPSRRVSHSHPTS